MAACRLSGFKRSGKGPVHSPVCHEVITNQKQQQKPRNKPTQTKQSNCLLWGNCMSLWRRCRLPLWSLWRKLEVSYNRRAVGRVDGPRHASFFLLETAALRVLGPSSAWFRIVLASVSRASSSGVCFLVFGLDQRASAKRPILRSVHDQASCCEASSIVSVHHATL